MLVGESEDFLSGQAWPVAARYERRIVTPFLLEYRPTSPR